MKSVSALIAISFASLNVFAADPVPSNRLPFGGTWEGIVGVAGGIPNRTTIFTTLSPGATAAQINSAIASCPSNQVVFLNAGTYNLSASLTVGENGVTLRGATNSAGQPTTILSFSGGGGGCVNIGSLNGWDAGNSANWSTVNVNSGGTRGSTTLVCASAPGVMPGQIMWISAGSSAEVTGGGWSSFFGNRPFTQVVKVTGKSGNSVTFFPAINADYLSGTIQISWRAPGNTVRLAGIENLSLTRNGSGAHFINTQGTDECWALNIKTYDVPSGIYHCYIYCAYRFEVRRCNMSHMQSLTSSTYCLLSVHSSGLLIENNMFHDAPNIFPMMGVSGSAFCYNYITNLPYNPANWLSQIVFPHGSHNHYNLLEGNWLPESSIDAGGGSRGMIWFRNRMLGWDGNGPKSGNTHCLMTEGNQNYMVMAGNVLGKDGFHSLYNGGGASIFQIDSASDATLLRIGNYNTVNDLVPALEGLLGGQVLVTSYLHSSKPAWFGNLPWPPIDPGNYLQSNQSTNQPAGYRYVLGVEPTSGPVNQPPVAGASALPALGLAPLPVVFSSVGSFDPEGTALSYSWTFGDGANSTAANPTHIYSSDGSYSARLTVSDGTNTTQSSVITILVGNQAPHSSSIGNPMVGIAPLVVAFSSAGSFDPEGLLLSYSWNFGDGGNSTAANPSHTYSAIGTYSAVLTVSDGLKTGSSTNIIYVVDPAATLVAAYGFEEGSGSSVGDTSGNGNPGVISGATWSATGKFGKALSFGTGARVTVNDSPSLDVTTGLTLEAWVYPTSQSVAWKNLIVKPDGDPGTSPLCYVLQGSSLSGSAPSFYFSSASGNITAPSALPVNTWSHVTATYDGAMARLYVNGTQVASQAQTGALSTSTDALTIGGNVFSGQNWTGLIDEVRIYNRALTAPEITFDMNNPVVSSATALLPPLGLRVLTP